MAIKLTPEEIQLLKEKKEKAFQEAWEGFKGTEWRNKIDVRDFIHDNIEPYYGDDLFLTDATPRTKREVAEMERRMQIERERNGCYDIDLNHISSLYDEFGPGYLIKEDDLIVGFQTDEPLKRMINPFGGIRMAKEACAAYGYQFPEFVSELFKYRTTHNDGVFMCYTKEMRTARHAGLLTGLPDAYGRGRLIGDYRRVALYGIDYLIEEKEKDKAYYSEFDMTSDNIQLMGEISRQIKGLNLMKNIANKYGYDISYPAKTAKEAIQWTYFAYLSAIKTQNGAAMSFGRTDAFFDIYIQRDIQKGILTEEEAQELIDDLVIKFRCVRHLRTPEYNNLFAGDPTWVTETLGGMDLDGNSMVTKTSFRYLRTLYNLKTGPEPNLTVLYSPKLPEAFRRYCAKVSIETDSIQYESDDRMRPLFGDDYSIACCVSAMRIGKDMQFFGARCNLPKTLLLALNGGIDNATNMKLGPQMGVIEGDVLDYKEVMSRLKIYLKFMAKLYVNTMNVIHYNHDKYAYEACEMSLHDTDVTRLMAFGIAGLSVIADSLSAIKYGKVHTIRDENGLIVDFECENENFPKFGNDDDRVDNIAVNIIKTFMNDLKKTKCYRNAKHTLSALTITSNVMYGMKTNATPDGRKKGEYYAPGANPMHNRDVSGAISSLNSVSKLPYEYCMDGISNTFSITPPALGKDLNEQVKNLVSMMDGYFLRGAHHLNVNVLNKDTLLDAMDHPENYPNLTIRVSGYAVNFVKLDRDHQIEVIERTFHQRLGR